MKKTINFIFSAITVLAFSFLSSQVYAQDVKDSNTDRDKAIITCQQKVRELEKRINLQEKSTAYCIGTANSYPSYAGSHEKDSYGSAYWGFLGDN